MQNIEKMGSYLQAELNLSDNDTAVVKYALHVLFSSVVSLIAIIAVAWALGVLKYALPAAFVAAGLRLLSGGAHSAKLLNCSLMGAVISPGIGLFAKYAWSVLPQQFLPACIGVTFICTLTSVWLYAPADTPNKPITKPRQKRNLRVLSFLYLIIWFIWIFAALNSVIQIPQPVLLATSLGILWQAFSLAPAGYRFVKTVDNLMP